MFKKHKFTLVVLVIAVIFALVSTGIYFNKAHHNQVVSEQEAAAYAAYQESLNQKEGPPADWEFTIIATGDIMVHQAQSNAGKRDDGTYDFSYQFENVKDILESADLTLGNMESPLSYEGPYTGFPVFNAPAAIATNLVDVGFDIVTTANNHCLDKGYKGIVNTTQVLDDAGLYHTGTYATEEKANEIIHLEVKGVDIAFISGTYGCNGFTISDKPWAVDSIDEATLLDKISIAREEGAQLVVVMPHWGNEYEMKPNSNQTNLALSLMKNGADLILGNHTHTLEMGKTYTADELSLTDNKDRFAMYSQGNFVSNQNDYTGTYSVMLYLTYGVNGSTGEPYLKTAEYIPTFVQKRLKDGTSHHTIWAIERALPLIGTADDPFNDQDREFIQKAWIDIQNQLEPYITLKHVN